MAIDRRNSRSRAWWGVALTYALSIVGAAFYTGAQYMEITSEIARMSRDLTQLQSQAVRLNEEVVTLRIEAARYNEESVRARVPSSKAR